jgi:probable HAF family extracellular repeat protein
MFVLQLPKFSRLRRSKVKGVCYQSLRCSALVRRKISASALCSFPTGSRVAGTRTQEPRFNFQKEEIMNTRKLVCVTTMTLVAALAITIPLSAQEKPDHHRHHQYKLIDMGTFGGPASFVPGLEVSINSGGTAIMQGDTAASDPFYPNCFNDCFVNHPGIWRDGVLTDLGVLHDVTNSCQPTWINDRDVVVGACENGLIDPLANFPEIDAAVWKHGQIVDIGTLGGNASAAMAVNNRGQVTGNAYNTILDPFYGTLGPPNAFWAFGVTQMHAFLWQDQRPMHDLGTLGGPDSIGEFVNQRGQVAGVSFTSFTPNPGTGIPTQDPFLWDNGAMIDLGTLGGTAGWPYGLNNKGQVTGQSRVADDVHFHAFLWTRGVLTDLGTLGGDNSSARWINDAGEVVGRATLYPGLIDRHGFLWKNGVITDLGILAGDTCSTAYAINSSEQIVGDSGNCGAINRGFLVENGSPIVDLQTLVLPGSDVTISETNYINDAGEISGFGTNSNGDQRAILLIPCDEKHPGQCDDYSMIEVPASQTSAPTAESSALATQHNKSPANTVNPLRNRFGRGSHLPGQLAAPSN